MRDIDQLRPVSAARLLELWRDCRKIEDPLERVLVCNGKILSECCLFQGRRVYQNEAEVLTDLTGRQIERLLFRLAEGGGAEQPAHSQNAGGAVNPAFDKERFDALRRE